MPDDDQLADALGRCDVEKFVEGLLYTHRTIQQNAVRNMLRALRAVADQESYDLRNEDSVLVCRRLLKDQDVHLRYI